MEKTLFLQYPKCSTCRKAYKWLKENNIEVESRDISVQNPTEKELTGWIKQSGLPVSSFFNTSGRIYREKNLKEIIKTATESELISLLASDGMLVKRPVIVNNKSVIVGFNEGKWAKLLK